MLCPIDGTELKVVQRQGVEIDYCPRCQGVWLDRGELDKIIEAAYATPDAPSVAPLSAPPPTVGVWADSIPQAPPQTPPPPPGRQPQSYPPPLQPQQNQASPIVPALGGLLAGLAAGHLANPPRRPARRGKKPRGWLEEIFDIDLD